MKRLIISSILVSLVLPFLGGCQTTRENIYYGTLEKFGVHKRDVLVDRVEDAQESQQEAKQEFEDALSAFMSVVSVDGGDLEKLYKRLDSQYQDAEKRARAVGDRIASVETAASALFREWEDELAQYSDNRLRRQSESMLRRTRNQYDDLITAMRRAEEKMYPVLSSFRNQVLFLKHNLNAMAVASIRNEVDAIERDVVDLVREMERAIAEADTFISQMRS